MVLDFSAVADYGHFRQAVMRQTRYVFGARTKAFLDRLLATSGSRTLEMPKGKYLWRAQLHDDPNENWYGESPPLPIERMKPLPNCREGRINPKGIPSLYLAADQKTAMSEVRPWIGAVGTLAKFSTTRDLSLVDCTTSRSVTPEQLATMRRACGLLQVPTPEERDQSLWEVINSAFSEPITLTDTSADYAPTQVLAEMFRSKGFDGIKFKSSLGTGINVALFQLTDADVVDPRWKFQARSVLYDFEVDVKTNPMT